MHVSIRPASKEDYPAILPIAHQAQEKHATALPHIFQRGVAGLPKDYFLSLLEKDFRGIYIAEIEKSIVGYAIVEFQQARYLDILIPRAIASINDIAVLQAHQGKGIGRLLFEACVEWAKSRGAASLELTVWEFNDAIGFYERLGMKTINRTMSLSLDAK